MTENTVITKKILIIEDNTEIRENIQEILELYGYNTLSAENGTIGVQKALEYLPDLILCDVMMPELDGFGVLNILSKKPSTTDVPFIFLTAKTEKDDIRRGMNLGADDYITKPFYKDELLAAIEIRLNKAERQKISVRNAQEANQSGFINEGNAELELDKLSQGREIRTYQKKDIIFEAGKMPRNLYLIQSGKVKICKSTADGRELIIEIATTGQYLGHLDIISGNDYSETAITLETATIAVIPKDDFLKLLYGNKNVTAKFVKQLANNVMEKEEQILTMAYFNVRKRVADAILQLAENESDNKNKVLSMYREDLAAVVGTAKETLIRMLSEFKDAGYIDIQRGMILILKEDKLANMPG